MARMVGPGSVKSKFRGTMGGVRSKVGNRAMSNRVATATTNKAQSGTQTQGTIAKPIQFRKPIKKF